ncbi:hypothetical protein BIFANG_03643 [Bifidobacterium angulatum DSM 20098 = JCM 7096]|uniref:Uncharacterized protein n=1 Tax=Bifidobacterium angulatum DSM 20098 = JCM 7096 TaxID=518635 RepID=C4FH12_9BIFI|nr:hypothetical protein BIFANG_03643 [Bifidobacterium angulatum DSM 20098 = JCM 7096]BAQ95839.1 hypothetical protein BBAG_0217 [Bifidobacterium angulatum DSM 20098 = JCM 7096]
MQDLVNIPETSRESLFVGSDTPMEAAIFFLYENIFYVNKGGRSSDSF